METKKKIYETPLCRLLSTYKLPYGHLVHNNSNYWIKTTKMTVYEYPNVKAKKHKDERPLRLFTKEENNFYYRNVFIISADAMVEETFRAYEFAKNNDEILLKEYAIIIPEYFQNLEIFSSLSRYNQKLEKMKVKDGWEIKKGLLIKRKETLLMVQGKYDEEAIDSEDTLDFTKELKDTSYFYNYKSKIIMYNTPALKITTKKKTKVYESETESIVDLGHIFVYKKTVKILNCTSADVFGSFFLLANRDGIFLIYKDLIVFKKEKNVIGGNIKKMKYYSAGNNIVKKTLADLFFMLSLFYEYVFVTKKDEMFLDPLKSTLLRLIPIPKIENVVIALILANFHKFVESFLSDLFSHNTLQAETFYANLYRRLDDRNREYLKIFDFKVNYVQNLYKIVLYLPEKTEEFVQMAISQKKEYYVRELISYYKKQKFSAKLTDLRLYLLKNNCFYLYGECLEEKEDLLEEIRELVDIERENIQIQFNKDFYHS